MSDPVWHGIIVLLVYIGGAVTLGVVSDRFKRDKVLLASLLVICLGVLGAGSSHLGWHTGWRELLDILSSAFAWYWFACAVLFTIPFLVGRYVARFVLNKTRRGSSETEVV